MRLDLGCGPRPRDGYDGVDRAPLGQRWTAELAAYPWTLHGDGGPVVLEDGSVDALFSSHLVEHLVDLVGFMNEAWRVLTPGGLFEIFHPYAWSDWAWQDPTHVRGLVEASWYYYDAEWREESGLAGYPITADFFVKQIDYVLAPEWEARRRQAIAEGQVWRPDAIRNGVNIVNELHVLLEARK